MEPNYEMNILSNMMNSVHRRVSLNYAKSRNYDNNTFNDIIDCIYKYTEIKKHHPHAIIEAYTTYNKYEYISQRDIGKFYIRTVYVDNNIKYNIMEYDDYLFHYISEKFNVPIPFIKTYIKYKDFEL